MNWKLPVFAPTPALSPFQLRKLEDRVLFDAVLDPSLLDSGDADPTVVAVNTASQALDAALSASDSSFLQAAAQSGTSTDIAANISDNTQPAKRELVLVDTSIDGYEQVLADLLTQQSSGRSLEFALLDPSRDGIQQITDILATHHGLDSIHLISHGEDGAVRIGNTWLSSTNLNEYASSVAAWGNALVSDGDWLIYSCNFASTSVGRDMATALASLTGADISASDDLTGAAYRGGDWNFEFNTGTIESSNAISQAFQASYDRILAAGPNVSISGLQNAAVGTTNNFTVTFENTGNFTGYGPFIDLIFPVNGKDGSTATLSDGISFKNATYLGQTLNYIELTFPDDGGGTGTVSHPLAKDSSGNPLQVTGKTGDHLIVLQLPVASMAANQLPLVVVVNATMQSQASLSDALTIQARSGFRFGQDALDNPLQDPTLVSDTNRFVNNPAQPASGWAAQLSVVPLPPPATLGISKTLLSTEIINSSNGFNDVVIGELATYEVFVTLPDLSLPALQVVDALDRGLTFYRMLSAETTEISFDGTLMPNIVFNSQTITWDVGNVTDNAIGNNVGGTIRLLYQTLVLNVSTNQEGKVLNSVATVTFDNNPATAVSTATQNIVVRESSVDISESIAVNGVVNQTVASAGDAVQFRYLLQNTGSIDAYDVTFSTTLPRLPSTNLSAIIAPTVNVQDSFGLLQSSDFVVSGSQAFGYTVALRSPSSLDLLFDQTGRTVLITIDGTLATGISPNQFFTNTGNITWTSLDGDRATPSNDGERDGSNPTLNTADYAASANALFSSAPPAFIKTLFATDQTETSGSQVTIGEVATYALVVYLSEGTTTDLVLSDLLPAGLSYLGYSIVTSAADSNGLLSSNYNGTLVGQPTVTGGNGDGDDVSFHFSSITTAADGIASNNTFLVLVNAVVLDVPSNRGYSVSTVLTNTATMDILGDNQPAATSNAVSVQVIESSLSITKNIVAATANAGEQMTIVLTVTNAGLGNAYDVVLQDILLATDYNLATVSFGAVGTNYPASFVASYDPATGRMAWSGGTIAAGQSVSFTFTANLASNVPVKAVLVNTASITSSTTLQGNLAGERNSTDPDNNGNDVASDSVRILGNSLSGFAYIDANNDGIFDSSEVALENVDIRLQGIDHLGNSVDISVRTNASGQYIFDNLRPGTYSVTQSQPLVSPSGRDLVDGRESVGTAGGTVTVNDRISAIVLPFNQETNGIRYNFGELEAAVLTGYVYADANNDGSRTSEVGIGGVTITLSGIDDLGQAVLLTTTSATTGNIGYYEFTNLRPSNAAGYTITESANPTGYLDGRDTLGSLGGTLANDRFSAIVITPGTTGIEYNFGEVLTASLSGTVYYDANNDGSRTSEAGIGGVTITLSGIDDLGQAVLLTTTSATTGNIGYYEFTNLRPSNAAGYTITESANPTGYLDGRDTLGSLGGTLANDRFSAIVIAPGTTGIEYNFGEVLTASLSGTVYYDANNDGSRTGEAGIGGVTITLSGIDDLGQAVLLTTTSATTGNIGYYEFTNLRPSNAAGYTITESANPTGYLDGRDTLGSLGGTLANDRFSAIVITPGTTGIEYNFGEVLTASLSGTVYYDANNDGSRTSEVGIGGVTITLSGIDDLGQAVLLTTTSATTGNIGYYEFTNLRPSNAAGYTITESANPTGYLDGRDTLGSLGGTLANDRFSAIVITPGTTGIEYNFGEVLTASLSGTVYYDANNDGSRTGEAGIGGVTITLSGIDDLGQAVLLTTTSATTGNIGYYEFTNLRPSNAAGYTITESANPTGYLDGRDTLGSLGGTLANDRFSAIVIAPGTTGIEYNFGEVLTASLSGTVYYDANNDGSRTSEVGIGGVTITLSGIDDLGQAMLLTTTSATTGNIGYYEFTNLRPSNAAGYTITESANPTGYLDGRDTLGSLGGTLANDRFSAIVIAPGTTGIEYNFGEVRTASLSGTVYYDANNDGSRTGEAGIGGVTITLSGIDDLGQAVLLTTTSATTGNIGYYEFTNLRPSNAAGYTITESANPTGYLDGLDTLGSLGGTLANDRFSAIVIAPGTTGIEYNFGETIPAGNNAVLSGLVYVDGNRNGQLESIENLRIDGVTIELYDATGTTLLASTLTDSQGRYAFVGLAADNYVVVQTQPGLYTSTTSDSLAVTVSAAGLTAQNFGEALWSLGDFVYFDGNGNGIQDANEQGIANVEVTLIFAGVDGVFGNADDSSRATRTSTSGSYGFDQLFNGSYQVIIQTNTLSSGLKPTAEMDDFAASIDGIANVTISGSERMDVDFGFTGTGAIGIVAWLDDNNDGVKQSDETGVSKISIEVVYAGFDKIFGTSDDISFETVTNQDGIYYVDRLPGGEYRVLLDGNDKDIPVDLVPKEVFKSLTLGNAESRLDQNFGFRPITTPVTPFMPQVPGGPTGPVVPIIDKPNIGVEARNGFPVYAYDSFHNFGLPPTAIRSQQTPFGHLFGSRASDRVLSPLPADPIFTGLAEPGTTLTIRIYDQNGRTIGECSVVADIGGNWMANFPGSVIGSQPHRMEIEQVAPILPFGEEAGFNLRRYFHPATHHSLFLTERPTVSSVMRETTYNTVEAMHETHQNPLQVQWRAHLYEMTVASSNAAAK